jgi:hypothetical protein
MAPRRLNLDAIDASLRDVQREFAAINGRLDVRRDAMTDQVRENMMDGYEYVDEIVAEGSKLEHLGHSADWLELNTRVLCGTSNGERERYSAHLASTERHFYQKTGGGIGSVMDWLERHANESACQRAAGTYILILSRPQLYIEGNHRTGALVMSYLLAAAGRPPFVLSVENAQAYFDPSTLVTETRKKSLQMLVRLPGLKQRFAQLLEESADERHLV